MRTLRDVYIGHRNTVVFFLQYTVLPSHPAIMTFATYHYFPYRALRLWVVLFHFHGRVNLCGVDLRVPL
jgi:hypothetical protein